ncbi:MAG: AAA family ATPase [Hespellia sp.]|nr:AAA family ATPase [Hespellia sp.]
MTYTPLPIGIDDFEKIITKEYYYVDKSLLIRDLLDKKGEVNLFTRPRRFGKTLNLSMLRYFFEKPLDGASRKHLFDGLRIMEAGEKYTSEQEQYPVITLTLKSAKQPTWELASKLLFRAICSEYNRHEKILSDSSLDKYAERYRRIQSEKGDISDYVDALKFLSECLYIHYGKKAIILIDEYDVPLENAYYAKFYDQMIAFIRSLFESALKTNEYLEFAVITGCLRISKESIFTGLNNLKIISILNEEYDEHFGFVESEVQELLSFYQREAQMDTMKEWYDGYQFGKTEVYNPWSVINYVSALIPNEHAFPTAAWSNTSSNSIVRDLIYRADDTVRDEIELLMNGETIEKKVHEDITYEDIYASEDNLWNFLFFTGYLKQVAIRMAGVNRYVTMAIPNHELLYIYENTVENWFRDEIQQQDLSVLYDAMLNGRDDVFQQELEKYLQNTISYMDSKEAFYHGFLLGLLANLRKYIVKSNREAGLGRYDICVRSNNVRIPPVVLELKRAKKFKLMNDACDEALEQIEGKKYIEGLEENGYTEVICYGLGFFNKQVRVKMVRKELEE